MSHKHFPSKYMYNTAFSSIQKSFIRAGQYIDIIVYRDTLLSYRS